MNINSIANLFRLRRDTQDIKKILESVRVAAWIEDICNKDVWFSSHCEHMLSVTRDDYLNWKKSIYKEDLQLVIDAEMRQLSGIETSIEFRIINEKNQMKWIRERAASILDDNGYCVLIAKIYEDISEQKGAKMIYENDNYFRYFTELSPNPILVHQEGKIVYANPEAVRILGAHHFNEIIGHSISKFIDQSNLIEWKDRVQTVSNGLKLDNFIYKLNTIDGKTLDIECNGTHVPFNEKPAFLVVGNDITEKRILQEQLIESEERYKSLFEYNANGVYSFDLQGNFISCNKETLAICGYSEEELLKMDYLELIIPELQEESSEKFEEVINNGVPQNFQSAIIHKNGSTVHVNITVVPIIVKGEIKGVFGIAQNITQLVETQAHIKHLAYHDYLTGLPNRTMLEHSLPTEIVFAYEKGHNFAVLFIDLDQFKRINDTMGHSVGDNVLKEVTKRLQDSMEENEYIFRQGGDEFIVIAPYADIIVAEQLAQKIIDFLSKPFIIQGKEVCITPSIGISIYPEEGKTIETLIRHADMAMYHAKKIGNNSYCFYKDIEVVNNR